MSTSTQPRAASLDQKRGPHGWTGQPPKVSPAPHHLCHRRGIDVHTPPPPTLQAPGTPSSLKVKVRHRGAAHKQSRHGLRKRPHDVKVAAWRGRIDEGRVDLSVVALARAGYVVVAHGLVKWVRVRPRHLRHHSNPSALSVWVLVLFACAAASAPAAIIAVAVAVVGAAIAIPTGLLFELAAAAVRPRARRHSQPVVSRGPRLVQARWRPRARPRRFTLGTHSTKRVGKQGVDQVV